LHKPNGGKSRDSQHLILEIRRTFLNEWNFLGWRGNEPIKQFYSSQTISRWSRHKLGRGRRQGAIICARFFPEQGDSLSHVGRLIDEFLVESLDDRILRAACELGASPSDLDFLLSRSVPGWRKVVTSAARGGHVHVFRWMAEREDTRGPWEADFVDAMNEAARYGHLEIIKWLLERGFGSINGLPLAECIRYGHLRVVKWLLQNGVELSGYPQQQLKQAARDGHLETVQWIHENFPDADTSYAMAGTARSGDLDLLQWLHQLKTCPEACSSNLMDAAVRGGHFRAVEWLFENCSKVCINKAAGEAARAGNLPMLQWLHKRCRGRFYTHAVDSVASNGHLEVMQWLHGHRFDRFTSYTMCAAAKSGHLDVVRWLHGNRSEGCTTDAMDYAAQGGHLEVVKWLHQHDVLSGGDFCSQLNGGGRVDRSSIRKHPPEKDDIRSLGGYHDVFTLLVHASVLHEPLNKRQVPSCQSSLQDQGHTRVESTAMIKLQ
jgi:hypothetical protein